MKLRIDRKYKNEVCDYFGDRGNSNLINAIKGKYRYKYYKGYKWEYYGIDSRKGV